MLNFVQVVLSFLFVFGVVVFVHELGHFLAAKLTGVYAPKFSIGFGPGPRKKWGETQYILGVIPLGGYVRMASRDDEAMAVFEGGSEEAAAADIAAGKRPEKDWDPNGMIPFGPKSVPEHRWFESKSLPKRLFIMLAGVSMNALLTFVILVAMAACYQRTTLRSTVVGRVRETPETVELARQLLTFDTIRTVQGRVVGSWNDVTDRMLLASGDSLRFTTNRGEFAVFAGPVGSEQRIKVAMAVDAFLPPVVGSVRPGTPADRAGFKSGDSIVAIHGRTVRSWSDLVDIVSTSAGDALQFDVFREAVPLSLSVTPEPGETVDPLTGRPKVVPQVGVSVRQTQVVREDVSFGEAVRIGGEETWYYATSIVTTLRTLLSGEASIKQLGGPIMIAQQSASAAREGIPSLLRLLALLSINLAVLNLLPIPVLDGGQVVLQVAEAVKGRPFSVRTRQLILGTGVALVLLLMIAVSYNDILRLVRR